MDSEAKVTEMNGRLRNIYQPYLQFLKKEFTAEAKHVSLPLFMQIDSSYLQSRFKILFVGKELEEWFGNISKEEMFNVESLMNIYKDYETAGRNDSPFWRFINDINDEVNGTGQTGYMWTTISKFNFHKNTPPPVIQQRNDSGFELLREEIEILQPDMVFFFTGFSYDEQLKHVFPGIGYEMIQKNVMYKINHDALPDNSLILLHPKALEERGINELAKSEILKEIAVLQD
jgi:hypothetical protein